MTTSEEGLSNNADNFNDRVLGEFEKFPVVDICEIKYLANQLGLIPRGSLIDILLERCSCLAQLAMDGDFDTLAYILMLTDVSLQEDLQVERQGLEDFLREIQVSSPADLS
jgi:hypothetical protein